VARQGAQAGGANLGAATQVTSVTGTVEVSPANNPANTALLTAFKPVNLLGSSLGQVRTLSQPEMNTLLSGFAASPRFWFNQATWQAMSLKEQNKLVALAAALMPDDPASNNKSALNLPNIVPRTGPIETPPPPPVMKIINGGFETGPCSRSAAVRRRASGAPWSPSVDRAVTCSPSPTACAGAPAPSSEASPWPS